MGIYVHVSPYPCMFVHMSPKHNSLTDKPILTKNGDVQEEEESQSNIFQGR